MNIYQIKKTPGILRINITKIALNRTGLHFILYSQQVESQQKSIKGDEDFKEILIQIGINNNNNKIIIEILALKMSQKASDN